MEKEKSVGIVAIVFTLLVLSVTVVSAAQSATSEKGFFSKFVDWIKSFFTSSGVTGAQVSIPQTSPPTFGLMQTETPTETPTSTPTETPTETPTSTVTPTETPTSTATPTETPTSTPTSTPTAIPTGIPTSTPTPTGTPTMTCGRCETLVCPTPTPTPTEQVPDSVIQQVPPPACTCVPIPGCSQVSGGTNPMQAPFCRKGSEYDLIEFLKRNPGPVRYSSNEKWHYIDNEGTKRELKREGILTVGPLCCADCCSAFCSEIDPRFLCLAPVIYDEKNNPVMLQAPHICRHAVIPLDAEKCKDVGGLACLRGLPVVGKEPSTGKERRSKTDESAQQITSKRSKQSPAAENQMPISAPGVGTSTGAFAGNANSRGALIAGNVLLLILVAIIWVLVYRRMPPKSSDI